MPRTTHVVESDLLIIGGGSAGLWAAYRCSELAPEARICIVDKGPRDWGGLMTMAGGDFEAVLPPDNVDEWVQDFIYYFDGLCDQNLMEEILKRSADRLHDYERFGCEFFKKEDGSMKYVPQRGLDHVKLYPAQLKGRGGELMVKNIVRQLKQRSVERVGRILLTELLRIHEEQPILVITGIDPLGVLAQPVLDYEAHRVQLDTPAVRRALELEKVFRTGDIAYDLARGLFNDADPAQVRDGFAGGVPFALLQDSKFSINLLRQCQALGVEASVLPVPNEEGTVTAEIGSYAMGSRNTEHPEEVADLLLYLVGEECQSAAAYADCDSFPVRKGCMQACFDAQYQFSVRDASREKLTEAEIAERQGRYGAPLDAARIKQFETICDQVTAAHYQTIWYRGVDLGQTETGENVASFLHVQYWNDEITLDELIGILSSKMRLYLDE